MEECDILIRHYIMHKHVCAENEMLLLFFYEISVSISVYLIAYPLMLSIYTCVLYIYILISRRDKCTMCKYDIKDEIHKEHSLSLSVLPLQTLLTCLSAL